MLKEILNSIRESINVDAIPNQKGAKFECLDNIGKVCYVLDGKIFYNVYYDIYNMKWCNEYSHPAIADYAIELNFIDDKSLQLKNGIIESINYDTHYSKVKYKNKKSLKKYGIYPVRFKEKFRNDEYEVIVLTNTPIEKIMKNKDFLENYIITDECVTTNKKFGSVKKFNELLEKNGYLLDQNQIFENLKDLLIEIAKKVKPNK